MGEGEGGQNDGSGVFTVMSFFCLTPKKDFLQEIAKVTKM